MTAFIYLELTGNDAGKFLQGQVTCDVHKLNDNYTATAICNLKGRVHFGLWLKKTADGFGLVLADDLADDFIKHIKKYGAFSKIKLGTPTPIYPAIKGNEPTFDEKDSNCTDAWEQLSVATGNYWITKATSEQFQPQELRLHQRGGVAYDKGCYLGQEIVARLYFKASPKAYLHRIGFKCVDDLSDKVQIINQINTNEGFEALVVARPDDLSNVEILNLPKSLQANISRN